MRLLQCPAAGAPFRMRTTESDPVFCLTADADWASDDALDALLSLARSRGVVPTLFATHRSAVLDEAAAAGRVQIGLQPDFSPGSRHGSTVDEVVRNVCDLYPDAAAYRAARLRDDLDIQRAMAGRGIAYDSNLGLDLQPGVAPLRLATGLVRFPIFWDARLDGGERELEHFLTPGLKVLNVHPAELDGVQAFLGELIDYVQGAGYGFRTLDELYAQQVAAAAPRRVDASDEGRTTRHTDAEFHAYWEMTDEERQAFMKESFAKRNAKDPYATSRDVNLRELEIEAIARSIDPGSELPVLDLGCGNGLTLLRLAERFPRLAMTGVDFSPELIEGATHLAREIAPPRAPEFVCADAFVHIAGVADDSVGHVVTERFVMNLPSRAAQERMLHEIARVLAPGGRLIMCEASAEGFAGLNAARDALGLATVAERSADNVTVIRFEDAEIEEWIPANLGLTPAGKQGFSQYFLVSRVVHPALVAPHGPRWEAPINTIARRLQEAVPLRPGYGANVVWTFTRPPADPR